MHPDYLEKVLNAQVYDVAIETPLDLAGNLSARVGNKIILKREDMQPVFSFKLRGAYNKIASLSAEKLKRGVICASAGNHAQGVARHVVQGDVEVLGIHQAADDSVQGLVDLGQIQVGAGQVGDRKQGALQALGLFQIRSTHTRELRRRLLPCATGRGINRRPDLVCRL